MPVPEVAESFVGSVNLVTLGATAENVTVTFPTGSAMTAATWVFSGYINSWSAQLPLDEKITGTITIKVAGDITVTAST